MAGVWQPPNLKFQNVTAEEIYSGYVPEKGWLYCDRNFDSDTFIFVKVCDERWEKENAGEVSKLFLKLATSRTAQTPQGNDTIGNYKYRVAQIVADAVLCQCDECTVEKVFGELEV